MLEINSAISPGEHMGAPPQPVGRWQGDQGVREGAGEQGGGDGVQQQDQQEEEWSGQQQRWTAAGKAAEDQRAEGEAARV